ncbi:MAG: YiiX/YebB-like N1pC/P60 family cysteine hydrolase [Gemmatimonadota bacterium]
MKIFLAIIAGLVTLFLILAVPGKDSPEMAGSSRKAFTWNQDAFWPSLERQYRNLRTRGCSASDRTTPSELSALRSITTRLASIQVAADSPVLDTLENRFLLLGPVMAACPASAREYFILSGQIRDAIKWQSRGWDVNSNDVRSRLYRSLYGTRAAAEEVMLHHPESLPPLLAGKNEPSITPSTMVRGVEIHSGDILISRGGYPTSALIARGNDFPGNFSHIALVYVDSVTHAAFTIEAHIERGVAVSTAEQYLGDKKLRILVLRPRADLPALQTDPMLPHRAGSRAITRARTERIPYDFAMDYTDPSRLFCSEVASAAYHQAGLNLWMGISTISNPGLRRWLSSFGVEHFETQEPSDLEYDPQLVVVAEWRDPATLIKDHVDNAVIDAMLEGAERGDKLTFPWYQLPLVRIAKGYSWVLQQFGGIGPVPEGMSAASALRNSVFGKREARLADQVAFRADSARRVDGYPPPYWRLVDLAREAVSHEAGPRR